jgi:hypothetical protein
MAEIRTEPFESSIPHLVRLCADECRKLGIDPDADLPHHHVHSEDRTAYHAWLIYNNAAQMWRDYLAAEEHHRIVIARAFWVGRAHVGKFTAAGAKKASADKRRGKRDSVKAEAMKWMNDELDKGRTLDSIIVGARRKFKGRVKPKTISKYANEVDEERDALKRRSHSV